MPFTLPILLSLLCAGVVCAAPLSLTIESAAATALKQNPTLLAARLRIEEARGRLQQSGRLSNPELEFDFSRNRRGPENSIGITLDQRLPITARLRHERAVSRAEFAAAEAEVRDAERKLAAEVRTLGVKLLALRSQRKLRAEQLENSRALADFLRQRFAAGEGPQVDAAQVGLESKQIEVEAFGFAADEAILLGELRPLLGVPTSTEILLKGELLPPAVPNTSKEVSQRPDLAAAKSRAEAAEAATREQRARRWEDVRIGASYSRERTLDWPDPVETDHVFGLRFSLPLPLWNNNAGRIHEAEAAAARAKMEHEAKQQEASAEVSGALSAMSAYADLVRELDSQVLPAATQIEEQLRTSYAAGLTPLTEVLRARSRRLELQRQRLDALRDFHLARVRHSAASNR